VESARAIKTYDERSASIERNADGGSDPGDVRLCGVSEDEHACGRERRSEYTRHEAELGRANAMLEGIWLVDFPDHECIDEESAVPHVSVW
jgi:hypothetical protein